MSAAACVCRRNATSSCASTLATWHRRFAPRFGKNLWSLTKIRDELVTHGRHACTQLLDLLRRVRSSSDTPQPPGDGETVGEATLGAAVCPAAGVREISGVTAAITKLTTPIPKLQIAIFF